MKISRIVFPLVLILLTACASNVSEPVSVPSATISPTDVPTMVTAPSSTDVAESAPTAVPPTDDEPLQTEEQMVLSSFSQPVTAGGETLILYGHILDANGAPLSGYAVEIWQVDGDGIYDHPGDRNTSSRDMGFQFYGTSTTDENGLFTFRTIVPARYEPRPRHIHFKVKKNGAEVLTSQFYVSGDVDASQFGCCRGDVAAGLNRSTGCKRKPSEACI